MSGIYAFEENGEEDGCFELERDKSAQDILDIQDICGERQIESSQINFHGLDLSGYLGV